MNENDKQIINKDNCINLIMQEFPQSIPFFSSSQIIVEIQNDDETFEQPQRKSLFGEMMEFSNYVIALLQENQNPIYIKDIFEFMEHLLAEGDEDVKDAVATCFLENILNRTPQDIHPHTFVSFLGKESRDYCKAWDRFTGVFTPGLWEEGLPQELK
ncbi:MAG: hypothetical protein LLG04_00525 [Parachlamydia sp.]|nr:hypothetical protein [Parachlamydia sp.]